MRDFEALPDVVAWLSRAPDGTGIDAHALAEILEDVAGQEAPPEPAGPPPDPTADWTWRERLWTVPAETRLGTTEAAEALGRPKSWIYARTQTTADDPIPHRKLDGTLTFTAGELRAWIRDREDVLVAGPMESADTKRGGLAPVLGEG